MKPKVPDQLDKLLQLCLKKDRIAQKELFELFGPTMKLVCRRYLFDSSEVGEVLNQGFFKVFNKLSSYKGEGSFEGWIRSIIIRECLNANQKRKVNYLSNDWEFENVLKQTPEVDEINDLDYLLEFINSLPIGYRTVFNLIEIEGYKHKEVAKRLGIKEAASRSQLTRAKQLLRIRLKTKNGL